MFYKKMSKSICIVFLGLLFLILFLNSSLAVEEYLSIVVNETGKVVDYYSEYYIVQVEGRVVLENKYDIDLNDLFLRFNIDTLSIIEKSDGGYVEDNYIDIKKLEAGERIEIEYEIRGISARNPIINNRSVMHSALGEFNSLYPLLISEVDKINFEGNTNNTRVVSIKITNPTPFDYNVSEAKLLKTSDQDPNVILDKWVFGGNGSKIVIKARQYWEEDVRDTNAFDGEVYWLSFDTDMDLLEQITGGHDVKVFTQEDIINIQNDSMVEEDLEEMLDYIEHFMFMKKTISNKVAIPGETMKVSVQVSNFAPIARKIMLQDIVPDGFVIKDASADFYDNNTLIWDDYVDKDSTVIFDYTLEYVDQDSYGIDYFEPATLNYSNNTLQTKRITFIRQYVPEKKVYVQKKIRYSVNDELVVTLSVQNVGESDIKEVYIKEFLAETDVFREISEPPEKKGVWLVDNIKRGSTWSVSYVTNENKALSTLPEIYGVDNKVVLKTLVFENVITNSWTKPLVDNMEKIGITLLVLFPIIVFVIVKLPVFKKKMQTKKELGRMSEQIHKLKEETSFYNQKK